MRLCLLVPDLWPPPGMEHACENLRLPGLESLLGRGSVAPGVAAGFEEWLCKAFAVERQSDWPVAPLTLLADGGDPGGEYWLRADPVHLRVEGGRLILVDSSAFTLSAEEAAALTATLNRHFAADGFEFRSPRPGRWYLRAAAAPAIITRPLTEAAAQDVDDHLPTGADALRWHRLLNEVQMALHEHPVNVEREARGEPALNSVWFWGGGRLPARAAARFATVWADDALATGLARLARLEAHPAPGSPVDVLAAASAGPEHLVVLDGLRGAVRYGDRPGWREGVQALETAWFAPLAAALRAKRLSRIAVTCPGTGGSRELSTAASDFWKFWRGSKPLCP